LTSIDCADKHFVNIYFDFAVFFVRASRIDNLNLSKQYKTILPNIS
jgi:hypothetical protein